MEGPEAQRMISLTMVVKLGCDQRQSLNGGLSDARVYDLNHHYLALLVGIVTIPENVNSN